MNFDNQYNKKDLSDSEISLKNAILYAYNNEKIINTLSKNAKGHMKEFSYARFNDNLRSLFK